MKNNQLLPFERNRYYAGKMLTSSDFQAEQTYMNNKRRFLNQMMFGSGIVCGLGVVSLDDLSILVESGVAVDDYGREIVLESSVVKKLSAIDGFEKIQSDLAYLCLKYREDAIHSVYAVNQQEYGKEFEYNRVRETYDLFLLDKEEIPQKIPMEDEFYSSGTLFVNDDYMVTVRIPANVATGTYVKLAVEVKKLSVEPVRLDLDATLQSPVFSVGNGKHDIEIAIHNVHLMQGETIQKDYWLKAQTLENPGAEIVLQKESFHVICNDKEQEEEAFSPIRVSIQAKTADELVTRELGKLSLEMRNLDGKLDYICLAAIHLSKTENAYLIENIEESLKRYMKVPAFEEKHWEYMNCFSDFNKDATAHIQDSELAQNKQENRWDAKVPQVATGTLEIALGDRVKKGDIRYSGEIMHGLGKGDVFVSIGYEQIQDDISFGANTRSTYYGNPALFNENKELDYVTTAVKVLNDKGSFVVAARLDKPIEHLVLTYRWIAIRLPEKDDTDLFREYKDKSISAVTPTVVLGTKESYYFDVAFHNMESCSIAYDLTEPGSGEITADGVYTAPNKEGVYEIMIYCTDMPAICTYAYAIVKRKDKDDTKEDINSLSDIVRS